MSKCDPDSGGGGAVAPSMLYSVTSGTNKFFRWASTGSSFSYPSATDFGSSYDLSNVGQHMVSVDVDGDGHTDNIVAYQYPDGTMRLHVFKNGYSYTGDNGWFHSGQFDMNNVAGRMASGDFNGDNKGDVIMFYDNGPGLTIFRFLSTGSSFTYDTASIATGYSLENVGDNMTVTNVNGDNKSDVVLAYQYPDGTMRLHVFINGNSYQGSDGWFQSGAFDLANVNGRMVGGDFNGNGRGDVGMLYDTGAGVTCFRFLSTGSSFIVDSASIATGYSLESVGKNIAAGDIDADGDADIVAAYQYGDGTFRYHVFKNGNSYQGPDGWYQSGPFDLANVAGRITMGKW
jgi:hypothetical protein